MRKLNKIIILILMSILMINSVNGLFFERHYVPPPLQYGNKTIFLNNVVINNLNVTGNSYYSNTSNFFMPDSDGENHHVNVDLTNIDRVWSNLFKTQAIVSTFNNASGAYINITSKEGGSLTFNVEGENGRIQSTELPIIKKLYNGTTENPVVNRVYIADANFPEVIVNDSEPGVPHVMIARISVGNITEKPYAASLIPDNLFGVLKKIVRQTRLVGLLYIDGFEPTVSSTDFNISTGEYVNSVEPQFSRNNVSLATDGFFIIDSDGTHHSYTSLADILEYDDGFTIGVNKDVIATVGVVPYDGFVRMMIVVSDKPNSEYTTVTAAEADQFNSFNEYPTEDFYRNVFIPIGKIIFNSGSGEILLQSDGMYYENLRCRHC